MTEDHTPDHSGYGLTLSVANKPQFDLLSPGSFGHGGAFGTGGSVDPKNELVIVFLPQMNDGGGDAAKHALTQIAESALR